MVNVGCFPTSFQSFLAVTRFVRKFCLPHQMPNSLMPKNREQTGKSYIMFFIDW